MKHSRALTLIVGSVMVIGAPAVTVATTTAPPTTAPATTTPVTTTAAGATTTAAAPATTAGGATTVAAPTAPPVDPTATTVAAAPTTAAAPSAAPTLGADATIDSYQAAAQAIIGPTDDALSRFAGIAPFSASVPTPAGSFLTEFRIQYFDDDYVGTFELQLAVPAGDAAASLLAAATAAGMTLEEDSTASNDTVSEREMRFRHPSNTELFLGVTVTDTPEVDTARIQFEDATTLEMSEFTRAWGTTMALPAGGVFSYGVFGYDAEAGRGDIGVSYDIEGGDGAAAKQQLIAALPLNGLIHDAANDTDPGYLYLDGDGSTAYTEATIGFRTYETTLSLDANAYFTADTTPIPEPPAPDPSATTVAVSTAPTTAPAAPVSTAAPIFTPAVPAGATMAQIRELIAGVFGPTTDAPAELSPFIPVLSGIPTPPDAVVEAFDMHTLELSGGTLATGQVLFTTATPPAESLALYANAAAALGMVEVANATSTEDGEVTTAVAYEVPGAEQTTGFDLHVVDGETDYVQLTINTPAAEPVGAEINAAVVTAVGLPAGGEVDSEISVSLGWFSDVVNIASHVTYPGDEATVKASVDAAILAAGGVLDAESSSDSYQYYDTTDGGSVQISYYDGGDGSTEVSALYTLPLS